MSEIGQRNPPGNGTERAGRPEHVVVLSDASTRVERELIADWLAADGLTAEYRSAETLTKLELDPRNLEKKLVGRTDDPLVIPVRVTWLPAARDAAHGLRFSDLLALASPHSPGQLIQRWLVKHAPDQHRILTGEPARLSELRSRLVAEKIDPAPDSFARYILRNAVVTLERAERAVIGDRYKVPRLVAEQILDSAAFGHKLDMIAAHVGTTRAETRQRAKAALGELVAVQSRVVTELFTRTMRPLHAMAWTVRADETPLGELHTLNRTHPLVFLPSHRSYADSLVLGEILADNNFPRNHVMGGANLTFWPIGPLARRSGTVFIRRSFGDDEIYKAAVEEYFAYLLSKRFNLEWYFEGGRTRTGKLRPPRYGLLNYVANAVRGGRVDDALLVPVSITYERLAEVGAVAAEQLGAKKKPEGLTWLAWYVRNQRRGAGNVYVRFGAPLSMRRQLAAAGDLVAPGVPPHAVQPAGAETATMESAAMSPDGHADQSRIALQKVAFEVAVGINRATPITVNALVTLALLGVRDRALTLSEVRAVIAPVRQYIEKRGIPQGELHILDDDTGLAKVLQGLTDAKVVTTYAAGEEPVYSIHRGQHLVAAFYRNSAIHWFVNRALVELAILHAHESGQTDPLRAGWHDAQHIRDLLKFEFFFPERDIFSAELTAELELLDPEWKTRMPSAEQALTRLIDTGFFMVHRTLRSFFDAQLVVAECLARRDPAETIDREGFLAECVAVGRQMLLQARLHGPESVSSELFSTALQLAGNRGLLDPSGENLRARRQEFADQLRAVGERVALAESLDASNRKAER